MGKDDGNRNHPRRTNYEQCRDYVAYLRKPFTYKTLMCELGMNKWPAVHAMQIMRDDGEIVSCGRAGEGLYLWKPGERKRRQKNARKLAREAADMWQNGDLYERILKEI